MSASRAAQIGCKTRSDVGKANGANNLQKQPGKDSLTIADLGNFGLLDIDFAAAVCIRIDSRSDAAAAMSIFAAVVTGFRNLSPILIFLNMVSAWQRNHFFDMDPDPLALPPALRRQGLMSLTDTDRYGN